MNFDVEGKIIAQGDFFDFGGMVDAVYSKNLVIIEVEVKKGKKQEMLDNAINFVAGTAVFLLAAAGVGTAVYYFGRFQGKW